MILVSLSPHLAAACAGVFSFLWVVTVLYGSYSRASPRVIQVGWGGERGGEGREGGGEEGGSGGGKGGEGRGGRPPRLGGGR
jgi:hypothetical protein